MDEQNIFDGCNTLEDKVTAIINWLRFNDEAIASDADIPMGDVDDAIDAISNLYPDEEE